LRELYRVLKPGGWGIFQVPFVPTQIVTDEDPSITDPAERERRFGQYDHVRIYGKDYPERLRAAGFEVECINMEQHLASEDFERYRLPVGEPLYICRKPVA
jgi:SAM-dependent methyltransferase